MTQHNEKITPPTNYTVQAGDTLSAIAQRAYGNGSQPYWMALFAAQEGTIGDNPNVISPGDQLYIPAIKENPTADEGSLYIVKADDTLWGIVERYIHSSDPGYLGPDADVQGIVDEVYEVNKQEIGDNPNLIRPGQVLFIPGGGGSGMTH
jgi:nucleoid-associated protein YgaU